MSPSLNSQLCGTWTDCSECFMLVGPWFGFLTESGKNSGRTTCSGWVGPLNRSLVTWWTSGVRWRDHLKKRKKTGFRRRVKMTAWEPAGSGWTKSCVFLALMPLWELSEVLLFHDTFCYVFFPPCVILPRDPYGRNVKVTLVRNGPLNAECPP